MVSDGGLTVRCADMDADGAHVDGTNGVDAAGVRALAWPDLFPFLSPFSLYGLSYCMPELTSLISYCALS